MTHAQLTQILSLITLIVRMIERGSVTFDRLRQILASEGATADELRALDADLTARIERRRAERDDDTAAPV